MGIMQLIHDSITLYHIENCVQIVPKKEDVKGSIKELAIKELKSINILFRKKKIEVLINKWIDISIRHFLSYYIYKKC